ncbi:MAG: S41 family peptidase [Patescibacteria group bacterium UBA2103]
MEDTPQKQTPLVRFAMIGALIFVLGFGSGVVVNGGKGLQAFSIPFFGVDGTPQEDVDLSTFWKVWNTLDSKFVHNASSTPPTADELIYGAAMGLAEAYGDPYTIFLPPVESEMFAEDISGNFEGVGMEIGVRDGILTVVAPLKGTPAEKAGLMSGDKIIAIDGVSSERMGSDKAVTLIRGERGTIVTFTILRGENEILEIPVTRDVIEIPTIDTELREDGVFVIALYNFGATSPELFRNALQEFIDAGTPNLVIDLRGNPGGFLEAAVDMASWFLPDGAVVVREDLGEGVKEKVQRSRGYDAFNENLNLAVLIDGGSASASEILAGALKDHGAATIVGMPSFGKGSVQELINITSDTSLKVTVARWLTPDGVSISNGGLIPDVEVEYDPDTDIDEQLEKAAELLLSR